MIPRYTRPALGELWTDQARMETWRRVEVAACEELPGLLGADGPSEAELAAIRGARFTVAAVDERERLTDHDMAAFVDVLAESAGEAGRWIHFGLTSSDVLDTALALQLKAVGEVVLAGSRELVATLAKKAREHSGRPVRGADPRRPCRADDVRHQAGRFRLRGPPQRGAPRWAFDRVSVGALSGAVGTCASTNPEFEARVLARLGIGREDVSTQVVARDRHAELLSAIALAGAGLERLAVEVRHLQRTEVREVQEPFRAGQKGSSAMPHKRNPIKAEQISGLARVLRGNAQAGLENVALWHERDISHSSVERVVLPDSTILLDYLQHRAIALVRDMAVDAGRMAENLELTHGALFSQRVLLALVGRPAPPATTPTASCRSWPSGPGTMASPCASCWPATSAPGGSTLTRSSTTRTTSSTPARSSPGSTRSPELSRPPALVASRHVTRLADLPLIASGKVREMYGLEASAGDGGEGRLLMVASDRISTYDAVHPTPIPDKGSVLTGLSVFWFEKTSQIVANDLISATEGVPEEALGRALVVRRLKMLPVECVVRGYITGSGWKDYQTTGAVSGIALPDGLQESEQLPEPIFTPSTKADVGHDEAIDFDQAAALVGDRELMDRVRRTSIELYSFAAAHARDHWDPGRHQVRVRPGPGRGAGRRR